MKHPITLAGTALVIVALVRTGWVSDDAYIAFRTADNIVHGYGPVWNVAERVQAFTHPLWLAIFTPFYAITGEAFYTSILLGMFLTLAGVIVLASRISATPWHVGGAFAALLSSKAFVDFGTSGLESPLSYLLVVVFLWRYWEDPPGIRRLLRLSLLASLCLLSRVDLGLLVGPALAVDAWRVGLRQAARPLLLGLLPFAFWEAFSLFYYGLPFPNTAYAKLGTEVPLSAALGQGLAYFDRTLRADPATLPVIAFGGTAALALVRRRGDWPLAAGLALHLLYVLSIGGDFMMGRFLAIPFVWSVALLSRSAWLSSPRSASTTGVVVLALGLSAPWEPALLSGYGYARAHNWIRGEPGADPADRWTGLIRDGVADERRFHYGTSGLLMGHRALLGHEQVVRGLALRRAGRQVIAARHVGWLGYFAGPEVHIVDRFALADPLLARLPALPDSRIGHFERPLPAGYLDTIASGTNRLEDPDLATFYDHLRLVIAGPLWSGARLATIGALLSGRYESHLERYGERRRQDRTTR